MLGRRKRSGVLIAILVLLLVFVLFLVTFFRQSRTMTGFEEMYLKTVETPATGISAFSLKVKQFFTWMFDWDRLQNEVDSLEAENARLRNEISIRDEHISQMEDLLELEAAVDGQPEEAYLAAHVSARDSEGVLSRFILDKGSEDGVQVGMCVVGTQGLIGRVLDVGPHYCRVGTLLDPMMAVSVVAERSRDEGVLKGIQNDGKTAQRCELMYLPFDADLVPGDSVVTTDLGGIYPRGIPVGTVVEVSLESNSGAATLVEPAEDFARIENVLIMLTMQETVSTEGELP